MSDTVEAHHVEIGGPTLFLESPDGLFGEFQLPPGKSIEGDSNFRIQDCVFLGVLYRRVVMPKRAKDPTPEQKAEYAAALDAFEALEEREDVRMTLLGGGLIPEFVTLVPLDEHGK